MSSSINIYPFADTLGLVRFSIQVIIFLVGLYVTNKLIIKPALRLYEERRKRTVGSNVDAQKDIERAKDLEHEYFTRLKEGADEANQLRALEISAARQSALSIISQTQQNTSEYIKNIRHQLDKETLEAKAQLIPLLEDVVNSVYKKLGILALIFLIICAGFSITQNVYADTNESIIPSFWYSIFWPYFQFLIFIVVIVYFSRKPLQALLEKRREDFRSKLSEAHEAVNLANKKVKEYEAKVSSLEDELTALKKRSFEDSKLETERIILDAQKASAILLKDAERTAAELINSSKEEIKKELFQLAIQEVENKLTPDKLLILDIKFKQETLENINNLQ